MTEKTFTCSVAQRGFYAGPVTAFNASGTAKTHIEDTDAEIRRLDAALHAAQNETAEGARTKDTADIMETVSMLLRDPAFENDIKTIIKTESCCAEYAVQCAAANCAQKMAESPSEYLRARSADMIGIGQRVIAALSGQKAFSLSVLSAVAAIEISPAALSSVNPALLGALITYKGSPNSHVSILAGNLEIPYLYGNQEAVSAAIKAQYIIIDEDTLTVDPEAEKRAKAEERMKRMAQEKAEVRSADLPTCKTKVYANIAGPRDIDALLKSGADGVGLLRSEFLFLDRQTAPDENEQYEAYKAVLTAMGDKEVIIRTMDLGSDKKVPWLGLPDEINPALGLRGVRVSLEKDDCFKTQLRALLRAAACGNLKVMFPMIASRWEIDEIVRRVDEAAASLQKEQIAYKLPPLGIMVETPAAALTADALAAHPRVTFFSIGTNDLTQYTLAIDREAQGLDRYFAPHHPAILSLIEMTATGGHAHQVTCGVCGQLAADAEMIEKLIAAGVNELSVPVSKVMATKRLAAEAEQRLNESAAPKPQKQPLSAVADGRLIPMKDIPDPVFSAGQLGPCIGILPDNGTIYAPCDGFVASIAQTKHAITLETESGDQYLIHVGIDTVSLKGQGFQVYVTEGQRVAAGDKLMQADLDRIRNAGLSDMVILVKLR